MLELELPLLAGPTLCLQHTASARSRLAAGSPHVPICICVHHVTLTRCTPKHFHKNLLSQQRVVCTSIQESPERNVWPLGKTHLAISYYQLPTQPLSFPSVLHSKMFLQSPNDYRHEQSGEKVQEPTVTKDVSHELREHLLQVELHQPHCLHGVTLLLVRSAMALLKQL